MTGAGLGVAAVLGLAVLVLHLIDRELRGGGREQRGESARWARGRDLRALQVKGAEPGRLVLGRHGRHLIAAEARPSVVVVGPSTVSLKTTGFAIPAVLEWQGPVVVASVKSDVLMATIDRRRALGKTMIWDPTGVTG